MLHHVLFGEFTRFVLAAHEAEDDALVDRCLDFLEVELREGDDDVHNVVWVSFVENIGPHDPTMQKFIDTWPTALRYAAHEQRDWRPPSK